ncbi:hypothetical protein P8452_28558 [Trifolium repens]|nr:hypothetical protein P8452_28558 [Trifolium repens]
MLTKAFPESLSLTISDLFLHLDSQSKPTSLFLTLSVPPFNFSVRCFTQRSLQSHFANLGTSTILILGF